MGYDEQIKYLLSDPDRLRQKKPFTRGAEYSYGPCSESNIEMTVSRTATLPRCRKMVIPQEQYMKELEPKSHKVLYDENIPSITMKLRDGGYADIEHQRTALPIQQLIKNKQVLHLTGYPMQFTLMDTDPTEKVRVNFITIKQYWEKRNQDGMKNKMVDAQKSYGDAGLLYYFDYKGRIKSRLLSFADGYVLCPHDDENGDRILESVYYIHDGIEYIDSYDDTFMYRYTNDGLDKNGSSMWRLHEPVRHGFEEIPLITKRGKVAWDDVQDLIESKEILFNIFNVIQKRHGWGMLYVKGKFKDDSRKIAGAIILNDTSIDGKGDAKYLTPPDPQGIIQTLDSLDEEIQKGSSTTFLLPKDIKAQGDVSGIAVQLTQSMDIESANRSVIEWQNVADKMLRLFKYGLAKELVEKGINPTAITDFEDVDIVAKFKVWRPFNDYEYNQMVSTLAGAGLISKETGVEVNTLSKPDETARLKREKDESNVVAQDVTVDDYTMQ